MLIKKREAIMVTAPGDVIKDLKPQTSKHQMNIDLSSLESKIYQVLRIEPLEIDEISQKIDESVVETGSTLSIMGIRGLVTESSGKYYLSK